MRFHIFRHIDPDESLFRIKHYLCKSLNQLCLTYTGRSDEDEGSRLMLLCKTCPCTSDRTGNGMYCFFLADDSLMKSLFKVSKLLSLCL